MRPQRSSSQEALTLNCSRVPLRRLRLPAVPRLDLPLDAGKTCERAIPALARASSTRQAASRTS